MFTRSDRVEVTGISSAFRRGRVVHRGTHIPEPIAPVARVVQKLIEGAALLIAGREPIHVLAESRAALQAARVPDQVLAGRPHPEVCTIELVMFVQVLQQQTAGFLHQWGGRDSSACKILADLPKDPGTALRSAA